MCGQNTREERRNFSRPILCDSKLTSEIQREATIRLEGHEGAWLTGLRQKCRGGRLLRQMSCDLVVSTYWTEPVLQMDHISNRCTSPPHFISLITWWAEIPTLTIALGTSMCSCVAMERRMECGPEPIDSRWTEWAQSSTWRVQEEPIHCWSSVHWFMRA